MGIEPTSFFTNIRFCRPLHQPFCHQTYNNGTVKGNRTPILSLEGCNNSHYTTTALEQLTRIELVPKPWQGLVLAVILKLHKLVYDYIMLCSSMFSPWVELGLYSYYKQPPHFGYHSLPNETPISSLGDYPYHLCIRLTYIIVSID